MVFSISQYGKLGGVSASTIRYYEAENLLPTAERRFGKRVYYPSDLPRLKLLIAARKAGFRIKDIKRIIVGHDMTSSHLRQSVIEAANRKALSIEQQIQHLQDQRLKVLAAQSCLCADLSACESMEAFYH